MLRGRRGCPRGAPVSPGRRAYSVNSTGQAPIPSHRSRRPLDAGVETCRREERLHLRGLSRGAWFIADVTTTSQSGPCCAPPPNPHHGRYRAGMTRAAALDDPEYRAAVVDLLGGPGSRRADRVRAAGCRRRAGADAGRQGGTRGDGGPRSSTTSSGCGGGSESSASMPTRRWRRSSTPLEAFHDHTAPADWLEGLVKAYVGDGFAADFYREVAAYLDDETRYAGARGAGRHRPRRLRRRPGAGRRSGPSRGSAGGWRCGDGDWSARRCRRRSGSRRTGTRCRR